MFLRVVGKSFSLCAQRSRLTGCTFAVPQAVRGKVNESMNLDVWDLHQGGRYTTRNTHTHTNTHWWTKNCECQKSFLFKHILFPWFFQGKSGQLTSFLACSLFFLFEALLFDNFCTKHQICWTPCGAAKVQHSRYLGSISKENRATKLSQHVKK